MRKIKSAKPTLIKCALIVQFAFLLAAERSKVFPNRNEARSTRVAQKTKAKRQLTVVALTRTALPTVVIKSTVHICEFWLSLEKSELFDIPSLSSSFIFDGNWRINLGTCLLAQMFPENSFEVRPRLAQTLVNPSIVGGRTKNTNLPENNAGMSHP